MKLFHQNLKHTQATYKILSLFERRNSMGEIIVVGTVTIIVFGSIAIKMLCKLFKIE